MNIEHEELNVGDLTTDEYQARMSDAIDLASDQDGITWLTVDGRRIAAIVPVDVAEYHDQMIAGLLAPSNSRQVIDDDVRGLHFRTDSCGICNHVRTAHTLTANGQPEPRGELDCQLCADGKCRTPAAQTQHELLVAARAGLLSRHR